MGLLTLPRRSVVKPGESAQIDWTSPLSRGLIRAWLMAEGGGPNAIDLVTRVPLVGQGAGLGWGSGPRGAALTFSGAASTFVVDGRVYAAAVVAPYTVALWFKATTSGNGAIFSSRQGTDHSLDIQTSTTTGFHADIGDGTNWLTTAANLTYAITLGAWYHVAYVVTATGYTIYASAPSKATRATATGAFSGTPLLFDSSHHVQIGQGGNGSNNNIFTGAVDSLMIWQRALGADEVIQLSNPHDFSFLLPQAKMQRWWITSQALSQSLAATSATTATVAKNPSRALSAASASLAAIAKNPSRALSATAASLATLAKSPNKTLGATSNTTASIAKSLGREMDATSAGVAGVAKNPSRTLAATSAALATLTKGIARSLVATTASLATIANSSGKVLSSTSNTTATLVRALGRHLDATSAGVASATESISKALSATNAATASVLNNPGKLLVSASATVALVVVGIERTLLAVGGSIATIGMNVALALSATSNVTADIGRGIVQLLSAVVASSAVVGPTRVFYQLLMATGNSVASLIVTMGQFLSLTSDRIFVLKGSGILQKIISVLPIHGPVTKGGGKDIALPGGGDIYNP